MHPAFVLFSFIFRVHIGNMRFTLIYYRCPLSSLPAPFFCNRCPTEFSCARSPCATPITRNLTGRHHVHGPMPVAAHRTMSYESHECQEEQSTHVKISSRLFNSELSTQSLHLSQIIHLPITSYHTYYHFISFLAETLTPGLSSPPFGCPTYSDSLVKTEARPQVHETWRSPHRQCGTMSSGCPHVFMSSMTLQNQNSGRTRLGCMEKNM